MRQGNVRFLVVGTDEYVEWMREPVSYSLCAGSRWGVRGHMWVIVTGMRHD